MTTATLTRTDAHPRSLIGKLAASAPAVRRLAALAGLAVREHVVTVAAFAAVDFGAFQIGAAAGWITTGVSVLLVEFKVRD